jgi:steroid 5-alpha reductase family enzyme
MENIWQIVFIAWVVVFIIMTKLWYLGKKIHNYAIVDVGWAFSLVAIAFVYYVLGEGFIARKAIIMFMVFFWGFRLSSYLAIRVLTADKRTGNDKTPMMAVTKNAPHG